MKRVRRLICFSLLLALLSAPLALAAPTDAEAASYDGYEKNQPSLTYITQMMEAVMSGEADFLAAGRAAEARWNQKLAVSAYEFEEAAFFEDEEASAEQIAVAIADYLIAHGITELNGEPLQLRIVASSKNLRSGPENEYERIGSFPSGTVVTLLGRDEDGWLRVTDGELTGWCTAIHLAPFDGSEVIILPVVAATETVLPGDVNQATGDGETSADGGQAGSSAPATGQGGRDDDLFWLALAIMHEAGSDWIDDEHQLFVGNVVLNRVAHHRFPPTTIHGVVHQAGQYPWATRSWNRSFVSERAFANAQRLLNGERFLPSNVVFQAQFPQGDGTYRILACSVSGNQHWFGYLN